MNGYFWGCLLRLGYRIEGMEAFKGFPNRQVIKERSGILELNVIKTSGPFIADSETIKIDEQRFAIRGERDIGDDKIALFVTRRTVFREVGVEP